LPKIVDWYRGEIRLLRPEGSLLKRRAAAPCSTRDRNREYVSMHTESTVRKRAVHEPPPAVGGEGWRYHHMGIPTDNPHQGEVYLEHLKVHVSGFETSPYGIEWMRFDPDCPVPVLIRTVPHIAFEVDDLNTAIRGKTLLGEISSPSEGVRVAMILDDGAPVELLQFSR
jgi:hypothetical protein